MLAWSTCIDTIEPGRVLVSVRSIAHIRVRGRVFGYIRCNAERRWAWGAFDEVFRVAQAHGVVRITAHGLGGRAQRSVSVSPRLDLTPPRACAARRLYFSSPRAPKLRALRAEDLRRDEDSTR